jgi:hypothetical protein
MAEAAGDAVTAIREASAPEIPSLNALHLTNLFSARMMKVS